jgi:hypothetical protein
MGGFGCACGDAVSDNTDCLSYKAHLIADQDFGDFLQASAAQKRDVYSLVKATVYQCPSCSRLIVVPRGEGPIHTFAPDGDSTQLLLRSVKGEDWKRTLLASWVDSEGRGYVYWGDTGTKEGDNGFVRLNSWQEVEKLYYEVFHRLSGADRVGYALLQRNPLTPQVEIVHRWPTGSRPSVGSSEG